MRIRVCAPDANIPFHNTSCIDVAGIIVCLHPSQTSGSVYSRYHLLAWEPRIRHLDLEKNNCNTQVGEI